MPELSAIDVDFTNGEHLLTSYWGYLTGGGLIIADPGVEVGEPIALRVKIDSSATELRLEGTVVKREPDTKKAIIAFRQGEAHDKLLSEAMAETENVAPRRYARFSINQSIKTKVGERQCEVKLVNLSLEGCCLELEEDGKADGFEVGGEVILMHGDTHAVGSVVWSRNLERGLRMSSDESRPLLRELCGDLVLAPS